MKMRHARCAVTGVRSPGMLELDTWGRPTFDTSLVAGRTPPKTLTKISDISGRKQKNRVFLVGGGTTVARTNLRELKYEDTICVNSSVFDVPSPNFFTTKDYTFLSRYLVACLHQKTDALEIWNAVTKFFIVSFFGGSLRNVRDKIADVHNKILYDLRLVDWVIESEKQEGISPSLGDFRSGVDSGYGALQLAVLLGYTEIYFVGYDMRVNVCTHYHDRYRRRDADEFQQTLDRYLQRYRKAFREIKNNSSIKMISCSPISKFNTDIEYKSLDKILR